MFFKSVFDSYYPNHLKISMVELINAFKKAQLKDFHLSCKPVMLHNSFSLKHLLMATGYFWTYYDQSLSELCLFMEVRYRISPQKNTV